VPNSTVFGCPISRIPVIFSNLGGCLGTSDLITWKLRPKGVRSQRLFDAMSGLVLFCRAVSTISAIKELTRMGFLLFVSIVGVVFLLLA